MKRTVKIVALLMAVLMLASCFVGCSKDDGETKEEAKVDDEKLVKEVAEGFKDAFLAGDFEKLEEYFDGDMPEDFNPSEDVESLSFDDIEEAYGEGAIDEDDFEKLKENLLDEFLKLTEMEIGDIEIDGDEAVVEFKKTNPDKDSYDDAADDLGKELQEFLSEKQEEYAREKYNISLEQFNEEYKSLTTSQREAVDKDFAKYAGKEIIEKEFDLAIDAIKDADTVEKTKELKLEKKDDEWVAVDWK